MDEFLPLEEIYNRLYPKHLRCPKGEGDENFPDLCGHMADLDGIAVDMLDSLDSTFSGTTRDAEVSKFYGNLLCVADRFLSEGAEGFFYLSIKAIELVAVGLREEEFHATHSARAGAVFDAYIKQKNLVAEEMLEATSRLFQVSNPSNRHFEEVERASEKLSAFHTQSTAVVFEAAACIPLSVPGGKEMRQKAVDQLVEAADYSVDKYHEIMGENEHVCLDTLEFPGGPQIIEHSYDKLLRNGDRDLGAYVLENDADGAFLMALDLMRLASGMIILFHSVPPLHIRAVAALHAHWDTLNKLDHKKAIRELAELDLSLGDPADHDEAQAGILRVREEFGALPQGKPPAEPSPSFATSAADDTIRGKEMDRFKNWKPDALTIRN